MPVYALAIVAGLVYVAWLVLLVQGQVRVRRDRREAADAFQRWMRQPRNRSYFRDDA